MSVQDSNVPPAPHQPGGRRGKKKIHVAGTVYGSWTLVREGEPTPRSATRWWCRCECGHEQLVQVANLIIGASKRCRLCARKHAKRRPVAAFNLARSPYKAMLKRCRNPNDESYPIYGGRGITVCERWQESFANSLQDMGERPSRNHSIEREDTNGNYEPGNCRWATALEQARNRRYHHMLTCGGETKCVAEWADISGVLPNTIMSRLKRGYTPTRAVFGDLNTSGRKRRIGTWRQQIRT